MKTINKLTSLIGAVAFATVITMAVPTQSEATWSGSWTSWSKNSTSTCDTDKGSKGSKDHKGSKGSSDKGSTCNTDKGSKGSKGSSNKGSTCNTDKGSKGSKGSSDKGSTCNTDKGSKGSKDHKGSKGSSCHKGSKGSKGSKCTSTGKVCGLVFEDSNDNAEFDRKTDKRLANVTVNITDANGDVTTVTTNAKGFYCARGIAKGTAIVDIDENTLPIGAERVVGTDPSEVMVRANRRNWAGRDGYSFPIPVGNVWSFLWLDSNCNGQYDDTDARLGNVTVIITDVEGNQKTVTTYTNGIWSVDNLPIGTATIDIEESTLPDNVIQFFGDDPTSVEIVAGEDVFATSDGYMICNNTWTP